MTKFQRRLYMLFFMILFAVTAPVIVFFASGYRFDRDGRIFVYSGSITIKSWPQDVDVYLNNQLQEKKNINQINSAYTINGVRPGKYLLTCKKDGYTTWSKNIEIHSGISTEFWNVVLFPLNAQNISLYSTPSIEQMFLSPRSNDEVVFFSKENQTQKISLLNIQDNINEEIYSTDQFSFLPPSEQENIEWSSDNKRILIPMTKDDRRSYIIAKIKKENLGDIINLDDLVDKSKISFEKVRWMFDKNNELVILSKDHKLYYLNIDEPENILLLDENVSSFNFAGNRIYYTQLPNNLVWEIKDNDVSTKRQITSAAIQDDDQNFLKMFVYDEYRIAIMDKENNLYLFNHEKEKDEVFMDKIASNIKGIQFSNDGKKMLYWTEHEIWSIILRDWEVQPVREKGDKILVTRFSENIKNVQWMDNYENVIFSVGNVIKSAEIDSRDRINLTDVVKGTHEFEDRDVFYNKNNQYLFYKNKLPEKFILQSALLIDKGGFLGF